MKIFYTVFVFLFAASAFAQPYIPILEEDNEWSIGADIGFGFSSSSFNFQGEEIIDGKTYKKLYRNGNETTCRLREENGVLYGYVPSQSIEKVLIDFNMDVGDSIDVLQQEELCMGGIFIFDHYEVMEVSTQFIAEQDRKVLRVNGFSVTGNNTFAEELWIEGIGSTSSMLPGGYDWDNSRELVCFKKNGETTYFNGHTQCVHVIGYEDYIKEQIILAPSPVTTISTLYLPPEAAIDALMVFDVHGRLLLDEQITSDYYTFDSALFESGLYFYQVSSASEIIKTARFIVE